jgi:8-oxo-dGTP diphosphatase
MKKEKCKLMNTSQRDRACAAIIKGNTILMVYVEDGEQKYWTLPGGRVERGETPEQAVIREVKEEVCLDVRVEKLLFQYPYSIGECYCFLVSIVDETQEENLGVDPELNEEDQVLKKIEWKELNEVKNDLQVSQVIKALS